IRIHVHGSSGVDNHMNLETCSNGVERRLADAIVLSQTAKPQTLNTCGFQLFVEIGAAKGRIAVFMGMVAFADDLGIGGNNKIGMKGGAGCALHAMRRPRTTSLTETDVLFRMPVPRHVDWNMLTLRFFDPSIQDRDNLIAFRNSEGPARAE